MKSLNRNFQCVLFLILFVFVHIECISAPALTPKKSEPMKSLSLCQEGTTRSGFTSPTSHGDLPCPRGNQICNSGDWQGPTLYEICESNTKSCDGALHGSVMNGYLQSTSPKGIPCTPAIKTCLNGKWVGPELFATCSEL